MQGIIFEGVAMIMEHEHLITTAPPVFQLQQEHMLETHPKKLSSSSGKQINKSDL